MFSRCLHCATPFPANAALEAMPVGRRLAFDAQRGRLWVVCRVCERWNLTPLEERWEAVEACERLFRDTRVRVSTDNIGLARVAEGTELVRVGSPLRPEFAAWRYGDQFGRRRKRTALLTGGAVAGAGLAVTGLAALGAGVAILPITYAIGIASLSAHVRGRDLLRTALPDGSRIVPFGPPKLVEMPDTREQWGIEIGYSDRFTGTRPDDTRRWWETQRYRNDELGRVRIPGDFALPYLRKVLPRINSGGAKVAVIRDSVALIESAGGPERFAQWATGKRREWAARSSFGDTGDLQQIPAAARLAFEMALHEDSERRALEGELAMLEHAWRDAEEIASLADNLFVPAAVQAALERMKGSRE